MVEKNGRAEMDAESHLGVFNACGPVSRASKSLIDNSYAALFSLV
jgi:hypothetical protein